jgi:hypothetical protein
MFEQNVEGGRKVVKEGVIDSKSRWLKARTALSVLLFVSAGVVAVHTYSNDKRAEYGQWLLM